MDIPLFAGQGSGTRTLSAARTQALQDARSSAGATLLAACYESFHVELASLSPHELSATGIDLRDFTSPDSLLGNAETDLKNYQHNPILSGTSLFLAQSLRYLAFVQQGLVSQSGVAATPSLSPFTAALARTHAFLGFSSGILPACIAVSSSNLVSYISNAVEGFRLALWISVRAQEYRVEALAAARLEPDIQDENSWNAAPWSLVLLGASKGEGDALLGRFHAVSNV
jgi:hypothetical protein